MADGSSGVITDLLPPLAIVGRHQVEPVVDVNEPALAICSYLVYIPVLLCTCLFGHYRFGHILISPDSDYKLTFKF